MRVQDVSAFVDEGEELSFWELMVRSSNPGTGVEHHADQHTTEHIGRPHAIYPASSLAFCQAFHQHSCSSTVHAQAAWSPQPAASAQGAVRGRRRRRSSVCGSCVSVVCRPMSTHLLDARECVELKIVSNTRAPALHDKSNCSYTSLCLWYSTTIIA